MSCTRRSFVLAAALGLAVLFGFPSSVFAQEDTTVNFVITPKVGTGTIPGDFIRPKYIAEPTVYPVFNPMPLFQAMDYGLDDSFLVGAQLTAAQVTFLQAQGDVIVIPPLDSLVGGNPTLNQIRNGLEQKSIPGSWITATTSYRRITGAYARYSLVLQVFQGGTRQRKRLFAPGTSLDSLVDLELLTLFTDAAIRFHVDPAGLSLVGTIRDALVYLETRMPQISLMGEVF